MRGREGMELYGLRLCGVEVSGGKKNNAAQRVWGIAGRSRAQANQPLRVCSRPPGLFSFRQAIQMPSLSYSQLQGGTSSMIMISIHGIMAGRYTENLCCSASTPPCNNGTRTGPCVVPSSSLTSLVLHPRKAERVTRGMG